MLSRKYDQALTFAAHLHDGQLHDALADRGDGYTSNFHGEPFWQRFAPKVKSDHLWYYGALAGIFDERAAATGDQGNRRMAQELRLVVDRIREHAPAGQAGGAPETGPAIPG